ncbi:NUDIX domain-containing protein [Deinococcus sp. SDU3-2]|uniref:NUDIX domain-containing protein n=1 Tax=Deinococcus terrestris TaxID=2651870 RepID=A0A7X1NTI2_9DEIO|nr:NUDIX domain-containing protein [Deinococcus terrestris]MPY65580.1 NUDIX domain-containing protein [Deinococcus terrestris]
MLTWQPGYCPAPAEVVTQVSGVCLTGEGRVVLVLEDGEAWSLPGGHPEAGEDWEATLRREVREEACAEVLACRLLGAVRVEGLTPQPYFQLRYRARVRLDAFTPTFETRHRAAVSPAEVLRFLPWLAGPIGGALLADALGERTQREPA